MLPATVQTDLSGQAREFATIERCWLRVPAGAPLTHLVLARSSRASSIRLVIMLTVPLADDGRSAGAVADRQHAEHLLQIGLITLVGLITKHGIPLAGICQPIA